MSDFKSKFDTIIKNHSKEGFREEYDRLLQLLRNENEKQSKPNLLNLWVKACLDVAKRKIVKKTDPEYEEVKKYYNELKIKN